jgi:hypothetical protein
MPQNDEHLYARVLEELQSSGPIPALWAKAFTETNGNESSAKALYFRLRVSQLMADDINFAQNVKQKELDQVTQGRTQSSAKASTMEPALIVAIILVMVMVIIGVFGK